MSVRVGVILLAAGVLIFGVTYLRYAEIGRYVTAVDVPVQLTGVVTTHPFVTALTTTYDVNIRFSTDGNEARVTCLLGAAASTEKHCYGRPALFDATWALLDEGRVVRQAHFDNRGSCCTFGDRVVDNRLGWFEGRTGSSQRVRIAFRRDARELSFARPRLVVAADAVSLDRGLLWFASAVVLGGVGAILLLAGAVRRKRPSLVRPVH